MKNLALCVLIPLASFADNEANPDAVGSGGDSLWKRGGQTLKGLGFGIS